jgi:hypothetical protein
MIKRDLFISGKKRLRRKRKLVSRIRLLGTLLDIRMIKLFRSLRMEFNDYGLPLQYQAVNLFLNMTKTLEHTFYIKAKVELISISIK